MSMLIKKSTLLASLKTTLASIEMMVDVNHGLTDSEDGPFDLFDCNYQGFTIGEQEEELRKAIEECEKLDDSEYILLDANQLRDSLI